MDLVVWAFPGLSRQPHSISTHIPDMTEAIFDRIKNIETPTFSKQTRKLKINFKPRASVIKISNSDLPQRSCRPAFGRSFNLRLKLTKYLIPWCVLEASLCCLLALTVSRVLAEDKCNIGSRY
jgi:hypothetical protein